ncbi:hypothetical protein Tco_0572532 [Tanacetum coccineum]
MFVNHQDLKIQTSLTEFTSRREGEEKRGKKRRGGEEGKKKKALLVYIKLLELGRNLVNCYLLDTGSRGKDDKHYLSKGTKGYRLISWQCKKQIVVANSTTEAEYIAASNCYRQVLWIQNQLLDYGYNLKIHIDNESTICIVKNPVFYSKTKHIKIRHHFIRDFNEKKLIQMIKIHTD